MFEVTPSIALPVTLASLPRVFLTPVIPGWVGPDRSVHLPLMMDGSTVDIGIHRDDELALTEWVNARKSYFASEHYDFDLYPMQAAYEETVHPPWLARAAQRIGHTIGSFISSQSPSSRLRSVVGHLHNRWSGMQPLVSSLLYIRQEASPSNFVLTPQDLGLYGPSLEDASDLQGLLDLLETVTHVDDLIQEGMTDRITVIDQAQGSVRELHDVFENPADPWLELQDALGNPVRLEKARARPTCAYPLDDEGKIDPLGLYPTNVPDAYDVLHFEMLSRNVLMTGAYLLAYFRFDDEEVRNLEKRFSPHVSRSPDLSTDEEKDIVAAHLRNTGRGRGMRTGAYADLIAKVLRRIGLTS